MRSGTWTLVCSFRRALHTNRDASLPLHSASVASSSHNAANKEQKTATHTVSVLPLSPIVTIPSLQRGSSDAKGKAKEQSTLRRRKVRRTKFDPTVIPPPPPPPAARLPHPRLPEPLLKLLTHLHHTKNPTIIFETYRTTLGALDPYSIPLYIHQLTLRKITPSERILKEASDRRPRTSVPRKAHHHEKRLQEVLGWCRSLWRELEKLKQSGKDTSVITFLHGLGKYGADGDAWTELDDYNTVLKQYAAVGDHLGALNLLREMAASDSTVSPSASSYGITLQAIKQRLGMQSRVSLRATRVAIARNSLDLILVMMRKNPDKLVTPMNWDLIVALLKDTGTDAEIAWMVKWGYRLDLDSPDRPLNPWDKPGRGLLPAPTRAIPLSTSALNTILEWTASKKDVSRLIMVFETLTEPIPLVGKYNAFDEDDGEEEWGVHDEDYKHPHAVPNTITFNIIIRAFSRMGNVAVARHYLYFASRIERELNIKITNQLQRIGLETSRPTFAVNRDMILSFYGLLRRRRKLLLMRWLEERLIPGVLKRKQTILTFCEAWRTNMESAGWDVRPKPEIKFKEIGIVPSIYTKAIPPSAKGLLARLHDTFIPPHPPVEPRIPSTSSTRFIDVALHMRLIRRDIDEITTLARHINVLRQRLMEMQKEHLGRRVWRGKSVYFPPTIDLPRDLCHRSHYDKGTHAAVSKSVWRSIVRFPELNEEVNAYRPGRKMMRRWKVIRWRRSVKWARTRWRAKYGWKAPRSRQVWMRNERAKEKAKFQEEQAKHELIVWETHKDELLRVYKFESLRKEMDKMGFSTWLASEKEKVAQQNEMQKLLKRAAKGLTSLDGFMAPKKEPSPYAFLREELVQHGFLPTFEMSHDELMRRYQARGIYRDWSQRLEKIARKYKHRRSRSHLQKRN